MEVLGDRRSAGGGAAGAQFVVEGAGRARCESGRGKFRSNGSDHRDRKGAGDRPLALTRLAVSEGYPMQPGMRV